MRGLRINEQWMDDRLQAELLRSLFASHAFSPPLRPFAAELFLADAAFLRSAAWKLAGRSRSWTEEKNRYLNERLDDQIGYLESKGNLSARRLARLGTIFKFSSFGALILGAAAVTSGMNGWKPPSLVGSVLLDFLPNVLPALAAWCLSMIALFEYKRRASLYLQMVERLKIRRTELTSARCRVTAAAAVASCERLLLTELWEWSDTRGKRR